MTTSPQSPAGWLPRDRDQLQTRYTCQFEYGTIPLPFTLVHNATWTTQCCVMKCDCTEISHPPLPKWSWLHRSGLTLQPHPPRRGMDNEEPASQLNHVTAGKCYTDPSISQHVCHVNECVRSTVWNACRLSSAWSIRGTIDSLRR